MSSIRFPPPARISLVVTTWGTDTYYTQACLESIARWKRDHHEVIVVAHDESQLLGAYLRAAQARGWVDRLLWARTGHGHTRGFNLAVRHSSANVIFNICNDILIGPSLVDDCAHKLRTDPTLGLIGWHWYNEGTFWKDGRIVDSRLRDADNPDLTADQERTVRAAKWFTGKAFEALGGPRWLCLCNTAFFGVRREVLERVGDGFDQAYEHYWADDYLNYAVLDQGLDLRHFEAKFRGPPYFQEFQYLNTDVQDRWRHADRIVLPGAYLDAARLLGGGMSEGEWALLRLLAEGAPESATVTSLGTWRGASAIALLDGFKGRRATFHFIDSFDLPGISEMSAQPPVRREEFLKYIEPFVGAHHDVHVRKANTLDLDRLPSSDLIVVDAGHTAECVRHDARLAETALTADGVAAFNDYGCPDWPDVKPEVDAVFGALPAYETLAIHRAAPDRRVGFEWEASGDATDAAPPLPRLA